MVMDTGYLAQPRDGSSSLRGGGEEEEGRKRRKQGKEASASASGALGAVFTTCSIGSAYIEIKPMGVVHDVSCELS